MSRFVSTWFLQLLPSHQNSKQEGWCLKKGRDFPYIWRKRWIVTDRFTLSIYKSQAAQIDQRGANFRIDMRGTDVQLQNEAIQLSKNNTRIQLKPIDEQNWHEIFLHIVKTYPLVTRKTVTNPHYF